MKVAFWAMLCGLLLTACSSAPVMADRTPTPDALIVTVAALQTQNAQLATQVAELPATLDNPSTATLQPTQAPSSTPIDPLNPTATVMLRPSASPRPVPTAMPLEPQILRFTVEPSEVNIGDSVSLRWNTLNATQVIIQERGLPAVYGPMTYDEMHVSSSGYWTSKISNRGWSQSVFRLVASDSAGNSVWQEVTIKVQCAERFFFSQQPRIDCPTGPASTSAAADEVFEGGRLIWLEASRLIYELRAGGQLVIYRDTWTDDQPASDPAITPPAGRYQPVRGFGKVWRTEPYLQNRLGWALAPEQGYQTQLQSSSVGCHTDSEGGFYVQTSDGRILHMCEGYKLPGYWEDVTP